MLLNHLDKLKTECRVVLASGSVNRRNILKNAGLDFDQGHFEVSPSGFEEDLPKESFSTSVEYVIKTSEMKLEYKVKELLSELNQPKDEANEGE